jgi:hypothetical protein
MGWPWQPLMSFDERVAESSRVPHTQRVFNDQLRTRLSRGLIVWIIPPPPPSVGQPATPRMTEKERQLAERGGGKGVGGSSQIIRQQERPGPL